jgi:CMP-N-acetylneuraminic acid synthetase
VELAVRAGVEVPFRRPPNLATDDASHLDVVRHALDWYRATTGGLPDAVVLLQPTSPFRTGADIDGAVARLRQGARAVVGVAQCREHPDRCYIIEGGHLRPYGVASAAARRQDLPPAYRVNGALYVIEPGHLLDTAQFIPPDAVPYVMPIERSVDIDTEMDLMWAAFCLQFGAATRP